MLLTAHGRKRRTRGETRHSLRAVSEVRVLFGPSLLDILVRGHHQSLGEVGAYSLFHYLSINM